LSNVKIPSGMASGKIGRQVVRELPRA
jgi:hypothetical protein